MKNILFNKKALRCLLYANIFNISNIFAQDTLLNIYYEAAQKDPTFLAARATMKATSLQYSIDIAGILPQISLSSNILQRWGKYSDSSTVNAMTWSYALDLDQSIIAIDQWLTIQQDKYLTRQAAIQLEIAAQDLMIRVAQTYFSALAAQDFLQFSISEEKSNKKQYNQSNQRFKVGLAPITDVYNAKASYDVSRAKTIGAENTAKNSMEDFRVLIDRAPESIAPLSAKNFKPVSPTPNNLDHWIDTARKHNLPLLSAEYDDKIAIKDIQIARSGHFPTITANGSYGGSKSDKTLTSSQTPPSPFTTSTTYNGTWSAGATASLPIYQGGSVFATTRQQQYNYQATHANYHLAERTAETNTKKVYRTVLNNITLISARKESVKSAQSSVDSSIAGYEVGTRTSVDVLDQLTLLYQQKNLEAQSKYDYINNMLLLKQTVGVLTINDLQMVNNWLEKSGKK